MKEKHPCHTKLCAFRCLISRPQNLILILGIKFIENDFFFGNYVTSEGAVSHNVLYYQTLPNTRCQVRFYANNYFECYQQCPLPLQQEKYNACIKLSNSSVPYDHLQPLSTSEFPAGKISSSGHRPPLHPYPPHHQSSICFKLNQPLT